MKQFEINKAYTIKYKENKDSYEHKFIGLCIESSKDNAKFKVNENSRDDGKEEVKKDYFYLDYSEINVIDFTDQYIKNIEKDLENAKEELKKAQKRYERGITYINNRSFLGKVKNFLSNYKLNDES